MKVLSEESKRTLEAMHKGKLLRIPRDGSGPRLVDPPARPQGYGQVPVSSRAVFELQQANLIVKLPLTRDSSANPYLIGLVDDLGINDGEQAEYWHWLRDLATGTDYTWGGE